MDNLRLSFVIHEGHTVYCQGGEISEDKTDWTFRWDRGNKKRKQNFDE